MNKETRVIFIGNYQSDKQESMIRFANLLCNGFIEAGYHAEIWWPKSIIGKPFKTTNAGFAKWVGYIDKWILFPFILQKRYKKNIRNTNIRFHICDHSNSPYLKYLPQDKTGITCHDVLAIRGAMGHADTYISASRFGKILQKNILNGLFNANLLVCNSQTTFNQLIQLANEKSVKRKDWRVIYLSYNNEYKPMAPDDAWSLMQGAGIEKDTSFILHVGNSLPRKHRMFLLDVASALGNKWSGYICFAGKVNDNSLINRADQLGLKNRLILLSRPENIMLRALYSTCSAFIYPSLSEGFPWPIIEAQACGAPVLTSNIDPMPEISGNGALHADPFDANRFAENFINLLDLGFRKEMIQKGYENAKEFAPPKMIDDYLALHNLVRLKSYNNSNVS